jgi:4-diphosphocytidyl-2-C-methyl-D-erythritol kinase
MTTAGTARTARVARVAAQAKVNLRLRILAREESGYHQIETLFLRLALADDVCVRLAGSARSLDVAGEIDARQLGPAERNLAWRAAEAYATATGWPAGFAIELTKRIPVGAGLGGGSADAGAVLRLLDALAPVPIGEAALLALASPLGADVAFLTATDAFALGWGRGERLLPLPPPPQRDVLLALPPFGVGTSEAYGWLVTARTAEPKRDDRDDRLDLASLADWDGIARLATNDFEPVVRARHPQIGALVDALRAAGCAPAMMSGSGSTVFGVLPSGARVEAPQFPTEDPRNPPRVLLTRTALEVQPVSVEE